VTRRLGVEPGQTCSCHPSDAQGGDDAAVDEQVGAGDEAGVRPEQEGGGGGHLVGGTDSAGGGAALSCGSASVSGVVVGLASNPRRRRAPVKEDQVLAFLAYTPASAPIPMRAKSNWRPCRIQSNPEVTPTCSSVAT
jgi:hypothetical protein